MDLPLIPLHQFQAFLICLSRVAALIVATPLISGAEAPVQAKIGLIFTITLVLFPVMEPFTPQVPFSLFEFAIMVCNELLLGVLLGLIANLIFTAVTFGGTVIGYQMGFAAANIFDPQTTQQRSLMSQFENVIAILIFLSLNLHYIFLRTIVESYILLPPGHLDFSGGAVGMLMTLGSRMFLLSVKFCIPILIILLLSNMVLGILARIFPQLNVFLLSFPINIGTSFLVIGLTLNLTVRILRQEFDTMAHDILTILQLL